MPRDPAQPSRLRVAGWAWRLAGLAVLLGEAIAAAAFTPTYSYARNYLSDLAVPVCGVVIARHTSGGRRLLALGLAVVQAAGLALVLAFPGPPPANPAEVTLADHVLGATAAILCGNLAILVYRWPSELGAPGVLRWAGLWLPLAGFGAVAGLVKAQATHDFIVGDGVWERVSVYTILGWEIAAGAWLLRRGELPVR